MAMNGRSEYEADLAKTPAYPDGSARKTWDQLPKWAQDSWARGIANPDAATIDQLRTDTNATFWYLGDKFILTRDGNAGTALYALQVTGELAGHLRMFSPDTPVKRSTERVLRGV